MAWNLPFVKKEPEQDEINQKTRRHEKIDSKTTQKTNTEIKDFKERPRICLLDVEPEIDIHLESKGYNCFQGTLGSLVKIPNNKPGDEHLCLLNYNFPPNLHEYDILIIDLQRPTKIEYKKEDHRRNLSINQIQKYFVCSFPQNLFDPRPFSSYILFSRLEKFKKKESIILVFADTNEIVKYQLGEIRDYGLRKTRQVKYNLYDFYSFLPGSENETGRDTEVISGEEFEITKLLKNHNKDAIYFIDFKHPMKDLDEGYGKDPDFYPLIRSSGDTIVSFAYKIKNNLSIFFPVIKNKKDFILGLLEYALPEIRPTLFPYNSRFIWLKDELYSLPNEDKILLERERIVEQYKESLKEIDMKIQANKDVYGYLHDLLTQTGDDLAKTVEKYLKWFGFKKVINVDRENSGILEEDLRIEMGKDILVIEVKGISGTSTDSECSQISKIRHRRIMEKKYDNVFALYIVNHERYLPPYSRKNPPFNKTQIKDAEHDDRGLLTTFDLFKLFFNIRNALITKEDARNSFIQTGLVTFNPSNAEKLPVPFKIHHQGSVITFNVDGIEFKKGMKIIINEDGLFKSAQIEEIQVENNTVEKADKGDIGLKLSTPVSKTSEIWCCQ